MNELKHYGVLGMRWGRRKSTSNISKQKRIESARKEGIDYAKKLEKQQKKGTSAADTLIRAERKAKETGKVDKSFLEHPNISNKAKKRVTNIASKNAPTNPSKDHVRKTQLKKKKISEMTNDELKEITNRLQLEKQYKDLTRRDVTPGKKFVMDVLATTAKTTATSYATKYAAKGVESLIKKSAKS